MSLFCVPSPFRGRQPTARKFSEFAKFYQVDWTDVLGKGGFSTVYKGRDRASGRTVAIKKIPRQYNASSKTSGSSNKVLKQEINAAMKVKEHDYIVKLFDVFVAADVVVLCMEYMEGDVLFKHIVSHGPLVEQTARLQFYHLAKALLHLHKNNIVHRDLKPENLMFQFTTNGAQSVPVEENVLKITDFGLSKTLPDNARMMQTFCGTPAYLAPEAWAAQYEGQEYDHKVDSWAFGVTLFVAISGYHPFDPTGSADMKALRDNVLGLDWGFDDPGWATVSRECKDILLKLISPVDVRLTAQEIVQHHWFESLRRHDESLMDVKQQLTINVSGRKRTIRRSLSERIRAMSLTSSTVSGVSSGKTDGLARYSMNKKHSTSSSTSIAATSNSGKKPRLQADGQTHREGTTEETKTVDHLQHMKRVEVS